PDLRQERCGDRDAAAARGVLDDLLAADDRVGVGRRLGGQITEGLLQRVREHERAGYHRDADDDGEGGQQGAELAGREALEGNADHRPLTRSSVARMSWAVEAPRSSTMWPSARNRMRSAIAAACASCVTMTVVWPRASTDSRRRART